MLLAKGEYLARPGAVDRSRRRFMRINLLALALAPAVSVPVSPDTWAIRIGKHGDNGPAMVDPKDCQPFDYILWPPGLDTTRALFEVNTDGTIRYFRGGGTNFPCVLSSKPYLRR